jgi:hypothetical protein
MRRLGAAHDAIAGGGHADRRGTRRAGSAAAEHAVVGHAASGAQVESGVANRAALSPVADRDSVGRSRACRAGHAAALDVGIRSTKLVASVHSRGAVDEATLQWGDASSRAEPRSERAAHDALRAVAGHRAAGRRRARSASEAAGGDVAVGHAEPVTVVRSEGTVGDARRRDRNAGSDAQLRSGRAGAAADEPVASRHAAGRRRAGDATGPAMRDVGVRDAKPTANVTVLRAFAARVRVGRVEVRVERRLTDVGLSRRNVRSSCADIGGHSDVGRLRPRVGGRVRRTRRHRGDRATSATADSQHRRKQDPSARSQACSPYRHRSLLAARAGLGDAGGARVTATLPGPECSREVPRTSFHRALASS